MMKDNTENKKNDMLLLSSSLIPQENYHPFPKWDERESWNALPQGLKDRITANGEKYLSYRWPVLPASRFMEFAREGNRSRYEKIYFERRTALGSLVSAECIEGQGRFIDDIVNGIWALCEESSWVLPAHNVVPRGQEPLPDIHHPFVDLFSAETSALLSWTHYLLGKRLDSVTPLISERIRHEVGIRIIEPYLSRDFWWMGFGGHEEVNNWNPWCNSNCLASVLLLETDGQKRSDMVKRILESLNHFLAGYGPDGGCDEGPTYWTQAGGALFDCLEQLYWASGGKLDFYWEPLIREIGRYIVRTHIDRDYFINVGDGSAIVRNIMPDLIHRYGRRICDRDMQMLGASLHHELGAPLALSFCSSFTRLLPSFFNWADIEEDTSQSPFLGDVWMSDIQVMAAREKAGSSNGFYLAAKAGHNGESHNHNDVGNFIVYWNGRPVIIDAGVETYTAKTFSPERYSIWTMQSAWHNLPTVNGVQQAPGKTYSARNVVYQSKDELVEFSLDIAQAYPAAAGVKRWKRTCRLLRGTATGVEIEDDFDLAAPTDALFLSLMTLHRPFQDPSGTWKIPVSGGKELHMEIIGTEFRASAEERSIDDPLLVAAWGNKLYRLVISAARPLKTGCCLLRISHLQL
ncbi:MAG: heparinase II/III family protein [Victivallales bacterium]